MERPISVSQLSLHEHTQNGQGITVNKKASIGNIRGNVKVSTKTQNGFHSIVLEKTGQNTGRSKQKSGETLVQSPHKHDRKVQHVITARLTANATVWNAGVQPISQPTLHTGKKSPVGSEGKGMSSSVSTLPQGQQDGASPAVVVSGKFQGHSARGVVIRGTNVLTMQNKNQVKVGSQLPPLVSKSKTKLHVPLSVSTAQTLTTVAASSRSGLTSISQRARVSAKGNQVLRGVKVGTRGMFASSRVSAQMMTRVKKRIHSYIAKRIATENSDGRTVQIPSIQKKGSLQVGSPTNTSIQTNFVPGQPLIGSTSLSQLQVSSQQLAIEASQWIVKQMAQRSVLGRSTVEMTLVPANLGELQLSLSTSRNGSLRVQFVTSTGAAQSLIQGQLTELLNQLQLQGYSSVSVDIHSDSGQQNGGFAQTATTATVHQRVAGYDAPAAMAHRFEQVETELRHNGFSAKA